MWRVDQFIVYAQQTVVSSGNINPMPINKNRRLWYGTKHAHSSTPKI